MDYRGPQSHDFDNVRALNTAFLNLVCATRSGRYTERLPPRLQARCRELSVARRQRLATAPFLLFSFREADSACWDRLLGSSPTADLFTAPADNPAEVALVAAGLGYVWQLARSNAYAARLICGASLHWCEQVADRPLVELVRIALCSRIMTLRAETDAYLWQKLLERATSRHPAVSDAARISALQRVLTRAQPAARTREALAARKLQRPALQVADRRDD